MKSFDRLDSYGIGQHDKKDMHKRVHHFEFDFRSKGLRMNKDFTNDSNAHNLVHCILWVVVGLIKRLRLKEVGFLLAILLALWWSPVSSDAQECGQNPMISAILIAKKNDETLDKVLETLKKLDANAFMDLRDNFQTYIRCVGLVDTGYFKKRSDSSNPMTQWNLPSLTFYHHMFERRELIISLVFRDSQEKTTYATESQEEDGESLELPEIPNTSSNQLSHYKKWLDRLRVIVSDVPPLVRNDSAPKRSKKHFSKFLFK